MTILSLSRRPRPPRGHTVVDLATFDRLVWPECDVELPEGAGWVTTRVGSQRYATWIEAAS